MKNDFLPGRKPVYEFISASPEQVDLVLVKKPVSKEFNRILDKCRQHNIKYRLSSAQEMDRIFKGHNGILARLKTIKSADADMIRTKSSTSPFPVVLALDQVQDAGNLGALCRTMTAFGGMGIITPKDRSAHPGAGAMKASAGAMTRIDLAQVTNLARTLDDYRDNGLWIYGAVAREGTSCFEMEFNFPAVLVLGGEEKGIRPNVLKRCHEQIHIPMPGGFESLNVAQAGAVILGQMLRMTTVAGI